MGILFYIKQFFSNPYNKINVIVIAVTLLIIGILLLFPVNPAVVILLLGFLLLFEWIFYLYKKNKTSMPTVKDDQNKNFVNNVQKKYNKFLFILIIILSFYLIYAGIRGLF